MRNYRDLEVWKKCHKLTLDLYRTTRQFPKHELFGLISQIRRSSASIGENIAEGCGRRSNPEMARFLLIATGSASELDYELLLAHDLHYIDDPTYARLQSALEEVRRMMTALHQTVRTECGSRSLVR